MLEIRSIRSPDATYRANALEYTDVHFQLELEVGEAGTANAETFFLEVATPGALTRAVSEGALISERGLLVLREFSWRALDEALGDILKQCEHYAWSFARDRLQRFFIAQSETRLPRAR